MCVCACVCEHPLERKNTEIRPVQSKDRLRRDILINMSLCIQNVIFLRYAGTLAVYNNIL